MVVATSRGIRTLPRRPDKIPCPFYMKTGECSYGGSCTFDHPPTKSQVTASGAPNAHVPQMKSSNDNPKLCAGRCGFYGDVQLDFWCSVCFKIIKGEKEFMRRTGKDQAEPFLSVEQREREREREREQEGKRIETNTLTAHIESLVLEVCSLALHHSLTLSLPLRPTLPLLAPFLSFLKL